MDKPVRLPVKLRVGSKLASLQQFSKSRPSSRKLLALQVGLR